MNEERPGEKRVDGRPFDDGVGPTVQALDGLPIGRPQLSAQQLRGNNDTPSWKAPAEKRGLSTAALIAIVLVAAVVVFILLRTTGII